MSIALLSRVCCITFALICYYHSHFRSTNTNVKNVNNSISLGNVYAINIMIIIISAIKTTSFKFTDNLHESTDCYLNTIDG